MYLITCLNGRLLFRLYASRSQWSKSDSAGSAVLVETWNKTKHYCEQTLAQSRSNCNAMLRNSKRFDMFYDTRNNKESYLLSQPHCHSNVYKIKCPKNREYWIEARRKGDSRERMFSLYFSGLPKNIFLVQGHTARTISRRSLERCRGLKGDDFSGKTPPVRRARGRNRRNGPPFSVSVSIVEVDGDK